MNDEVSSLMRKAIVFLSIVLVLGACHRRGESASAGTDTIAPASPQPASSGTDDALTQTVNVEDGRSVEEGGALNNTQTATVPPATTATTATTGTSGKAPAPQPKTPPAKQKKH